MSGLSFRGGGFNLVCLRQGSDVRLRNVSFKRRGGPEGRITGLCQSESPGVRTSRAGTITVVGQGEEVNARVVREALGIREEGTLNERMSRGRTPGQMEKRLRIERSINPGGFLLRS